MLAFTRKFYVDIHPWKQYLPHIQVDDLQHALEFLMTNPNSPYYGQKDIPFFLSGHSSGAHIASMFLIRQAMEVPGHNTLPRPIQGFIGLAGVYDVDEHYTYEARRYVLTNCENNAYISDFLI